MQARLAQSLLRPAAKDVMKRRAQDSVLETAGWIIQSIYKLPKHDLLARHSHKFCRPHISSKCTSVTFRLTGIWVPLAYLWVTSGLWWLSHRGTNIIIPVFKTQGLANFQPHLLATLFQEIDFHLDGGKIKRVDPMVRSVGSRRQTVVLDWLLKKTFLYIWSLGFN